MKALIEHFSLLLECSFVLSTVQLLRLTCCMSWVSCQVQHLHGWFVQACAAGGCSFLVPWQARPHVLFCAGTFLRGALEKVGVDPNIKRIGKYKSAGDQLLRKDMSEPQREQLTAILDDLYEGFTDDVAASKNKSPAEVGTTAQQRTRQDAMAAVCCVHA